MVQGNFGPEYDLGQRLSKLEADMHNLNTRDVLQNSSIGVGGLTITGGLLHVTGTGGIVVDGGGSISVPSGSLSTAGTISAGGLAVGSGGLVVSGAAHITGSLQVDTQINGSGDVSVAGDLHGTNLFATASPGFNITGTRVAGWIESATGRLGTATSSRRFKTDIVDSGIDPAAVLSIGVKHFRYTADTTHLNVGAIAEDLHAAGLWEFVVYEHDMVVTVHPAEYVQGKLVTESWEEVTGDTLRVDEGGQPIPLGIHYEMFSLAVLVAAQHLNTQQQALAADVAAIKTALGM